MSSATRTEQPAPAPHEISVTPPTVSRSRIESIDIMRGIIIVLMALDHTKDFIGTSRFDALDADVTNLAAYLDALDYPLLRTDVLLPHGGRRLPCRPR